MEYRKIATGMIEATYEEYKLYCYPQDVPLTDWLNKYNIPVWNNMDDNTKQAAIEYVFNNRDTIELHSGMVESWVQATAYFMIMNFASCMCMDGEPEIEIFFDDLDFMIDEDVLTDIDVQEQMGISKNFTDSF
jgi:hypothetical protein